MRNGPLCLLALLSFLLIMAPGVMANTTSVNGSCIQGTCGDPDVIFPGGDATGPINRQYTFADGDTFNFDGMYFNSESSNGLMISSTHFMHVTFVGNNGGAAVGNDLIDLQLVQGYHINTSSGSFAYSMYGFPKGGFANNSTIQSFANINGVDLQTSPVYSLSQDFFFLSDNTTIKNIVNPLIFTVDYQINIGKGTLPGASIDIDTPEPASFVLLSTGLIGVIGSLKKRLF